MGFLLLTIVSTAQEEYLKGREFWTTSISRFLYIQNDTCLLYIMGDTASTGYVENPNTGFYTTFSVTPGVTTEVKIPRSDLCMSLPNYWTNQDFDTVLPIGVHIVTDRPVCVVQLTKHNDWVVRKDIVKPLSLQSKISLHLVNGCFMWTDDCAHVYPFHVMATEDSTFVSIYKNNTDVSHRLLQKGEILTYRSCRDFLSIQDSGYVYTIMSDCKPICPFFSVGYSGAINDPYILDCYYKNAEYYLTKRYANNRLIKKLSWTLPIDLGPVEIYDGINAVRLWNHTQGIIKLNQNSSGYGFFRFLSNTCTSYYPNSGVSCNTTNSIDLDALKHPSPTNYFVRSCWIPTSTNEMPDDTNYADLLIYVHEDGLLSTTLNGQPVPASAFDSFPYTNREYWVAQFAYYNQDIPPYFKIENPHGFHADLDEIAYHSIPTAPVEPPRITVSSITQTSSGVAYEDLDFAHNNLSPHDSATVYRCVGDTLLLDANTQWDSIPCLWTLDGTDYPDMPIVAVPLLDTGLRVARLVLYGNPDCPDTITTFVQVLPPPVLPLHSDTTLCRGTQLSAWDENAILYRWSNGAATPSVTIDTAGFYSVTVTNRGCTAHSDSVLVDLFPQSAVDFGADTALCSMATLILDAGQPHPASYLWHNGSTNRTYTVYQDGTYWVVVTDHCTGVSDTIAVEYLEDFDIELGNDTTLCTGEELRLSAYVPGAQYRWQDGSAQPEYVVRHEGEYSVSVQNACFSHGDRIYVSYGDCEPEFRMPTAFTPDGDGLNDRLLPVFEHPEQVKDFRMIVFDRWGAILFVTRDPNEGWGGSGAPTGLYVVEIRYSGPDGFEETVRGTVTLVR